MAGPVPAIDRRWSRAVSRFFDLEPHRNWPKLCFIKRAERSDDPWSGHMLLSGGRRHREDQSIARLYEETYEEIGLQLRWA